MNTLTLDEKKVRKPRTTKTPKTKTVRSGNGNGHEPLTSVATAPNLTPSGVEKKYPILYSFLRVMGQAHCLPAVRDYDEIAWGQIDGQPVYNTKTDELDKYVKVNLKAVEAEAEVINQDLDLVSLVTSDTRYISDFSSKFQESLKELGFGERYALYRDDIGPILISMGFPHYGNLMNSCWNDGSGNWRRFASKIFTYAFYD